MTEPNINEHDGVTELYFEEEGKMNIKSAETAILEYSDGTTEEVSMANTSVVDIETNINVPSDTRVYIPKGVETEVYDPNTNETTMVYSGGDSNISQNDDPNTTQVYNPNENDNSEPQAPLESPNSAPDPDFSTPTDSKETLKKNYDWMFEKALDNGYEPSEAAEAANSMVQTFSDIDSMLE